MIIRGPFNIKWGENVIEDVESIAIDQELKSEIYETEKGRTFELDKAYSISALITLLRSDIPALSVLLPQYFVPMNGTLSTGEIVTNPAGAIDVKPHACDDSLFFNPLDIISCGNPGQITRILNTRTKIEDIDMSSRIQKVIIKVVGEPSSNQAVMQMLAEAYDAPDEFFLLDDDDYFLLNNGGQLIL